MSTIKALILDAGGVLVWSVCNDWTTPVALRDALIKLGRESELHTPEYKQAVQDYSHFIREDVMMTRMQDECVQREKFVSAVCARMNWGFSKDDCRAFAHDFTYNPARYGWYADNIPYLTHWKKQLKLGMLSDAMPSFLHFTILQRMEQHFDAIVLSTQLGATKPSEKMYLTIAEQLGVAPEDCMFVDDRMCNLVGARAVGMRGIQIDRTGALPVSDALVHNFEQLNAVLGLAPLEAEA